jgi:Trp operon repressor
MKKHTFTTKNWSDFASLLLQTKDRKRFAMICDIFLTTQEKADFALRYAIIKELLKKEKTHREITKHVGSSIAKVTRGANLLKKTNADLLKFLQKSLAR